MSQENSELPGKAGLDRMWLRVMADVHSDLSSLCERVILNSPNYEVM